MNYDRDAFRRAFAQHYKQQRDRAEECLGKIVDILARPVEENRDPISHDAEAAEQIMALLVKYYDPSGEKNELAIAEAKAQEIRANPFPCHKCGKPADFGIGGHSPHVKTVHWCNGCWLDPDRLARETD